MTTARTVHCSKLDRDLPGLAKPPFGGPLGQKVFEHVSAEAWRMWADDMMIKVINEYRLNMAEPADYEKLLSQMKAFLGLDTGEVLEVENSERGRKGT